MINKIFPAGLPVIGEDLIGRQEELERLFKVLNNGQNAILIAPRRMGKTSLALELLRRLKLKGHFTVDVDLFKIISKRELAEELVESALENKKISNLIGKLKKGFSAILKNVQLKQVVEDFEFVLDFASEKVDGDKILEEGLNFLEKFALKNKQHLFVLLDEFGDITKLGGNVVLKKIRAIIQRQQNVTYLFAGSQESIMRSIFGNRKSPFFRFAVLFELGNLPLSELKSYIQKKFYSLGIHIDETVIDEILNETGGHPYYTQLLCQNVYLDVKGSKNTVESIDVKRGIELVLDSERQFFEEMWQRLREKKNYLLVVKKIANGESPYDLVDLDRQLIYNILVSLNKSGVIKKVDRAKYQIIDPFFKKYLLLS